MRMRKRVLSGLLAVILVLALLPGEALAYKTHPADTQNDQSVSLGTFSSAAIGGDGKLYLWGMLAAGVREESTPICYAPEETFKYVTAGKECGAAITTDGRLYTWGTGRYTGTGSTASSWIEPALVSMPERVSCVAVSDDHWQVYAAISESGALYTWGSNTGGLTGHTGASVSTPQRLMPDKAFRSVCFGTKHAAAVATDGQIYTWGTNRYGQLGIGVSGSGANEMFQPTLVTVPGTSFQTIVLAEERSAAISAAGELYVWGYNFGGIAGTGSNDHIISPEKVLDGVRSVVINNSTNIALRTDGTVWAWGGKGYNGSAALLGGVGSPYNKPTQLYIQADRSLVPLTDVASIAMSSRSAAAITNSGVLYGWGLIAGTGAEEGKANRPETVMPGTRFTRAFGGEMHMAALTDRGELYAWGKGSYGEMGPNSRATQLTPCLAMSQVGGAAPPCAHQWTEYHTVHDADCTTPERQGRSCKLCGAVQTRIVGSPLGHQWGEFVETVPAPTCIDVGKRTRTCARCQETEDEEFNGPHKLDSDKVYCVYCKKAMQPGPDVPDPDDHKHEWLITETKEPTCTEGGYTEFTCQVAGCGKTVTDPLAPLDHDYEETPQINPTCSTTGMTASSRCRRCGTVFKTGTVIPIDPNVHEWEVTQLTQATCSKAGLRIRVCKLCSRTEWDNLPTLPHTHSNPNICAVEDICLVCKAVIRAAGEHILNYTANNGFIIQTCGSCGHIATATLTANDEKDYKGGKVETGNVAVTDNWIGTKPTNEQIVYANNNKPGTATASIIVEGVTASVNFKIKRWAIDLKQFKGTTSTHYNMEGSWAFNDQLRKQNKDIIVDSLTQVSLEGADESTAKTIRQQISNLLFISTFRPTTFGGSTNKIQTWHPQNADGGATQLTGGAVDTGLQSLGVKPIRWDYEVKGCYSYALYAEKYVYGTNGHKRTIGWTPNAEKIADSFHQYLDPGEAIRYEKVVTENGKSYTTGHALLFLGESTDGKGFYFVSYGGGESGKTSSHSMTAGYFSYKDFAAVLSANHYRLVLFDANNGSYLTNADKVGLNKSTKSGSVLAKCPVEIVVTFNGETLDSRLLDSGGTVSAVFGTMSASGPIGGDREILVSFNNGYMDTDGMELEVLGTGNGSMDMEVSYVYTNPDLGSTEQTDMRSFKNIPITATTTITTSRLAENTTTELYITEIGTGDTAIWSCNNGETAVVPEGYLAKDDSVPAPEAPIVLPTPNDPDSAPDEDPDYEPPVSSRPQAPDEPETPAAPQTPVTTVTPELPAAVALPFTDVSAGDWFYDAVAYVYGKGMMKGTSATLFSPGETTSRAMIVTILHRLEGEPSAAPAAFSDVPAGQWYSAAVAWAAANGIVDGYGDGRFGPADPVTREQLAAILYRYTVFKGGDTSAQADMSAYPDGAQISPYALDALRWAAAEGIVSGFEDGRLGPQESATRAQVAQMLMNYLEQ